MRPFMLQSDVDGKAALAWERWQGAVTLRPHEVHIWRLQPDAPPNRATFHRLLRELLGGYVGVNPPDLVFVRSRYGKPRVVAPAGRGINFSLSHSMGVGQVAVAREWPIGTDVEALRRVSHFQSISRKHFTDVEAQWLSKLPVHRKNEGFLLLWTAREAYLKAVGTGLMGRGTLVGDVELAGFPQLGLETMPSACWQVRNRTASWTITRTDPMPGYIGAVATPPSVRSFRYLDGPPSA